jgi:ABC-2 type transport system permease protein
MRAVLLIARHHLYRIVRNPGLIVLLLAVPLTLALLEYAAFGRTAAAGKLPPIRVLFLDEDRSLASGVVPQFFSGGPMKDYFEIASVDARDRAASQFRKNQASALVVIPKGFQDALLAGRDARIQLFKNPIQSISPEIADNVIEMMTVLGNGLYGQALEPIRRLRALSDAKREPNSGEVAMISNGFYEAAKRFGRLSALREAGVEVQRPQGRSATALGVGTPGEFFAMVFPGLVIFALMFVGQSLAFRLLRDRTRGLQRRILVTPTSAASVLWGGALYLVAGLFVLLVVLAVIGGAVFGIRPREPLGLLGFGLGFALFAAALQLTIMALARTDRTASFIASPIVLVLSLLGGSFVPAETYPAFLQKLSYRVPNGAAQQGFIDLLAHHRSLAEVSGHLAVTWAWALGLFALAIWAERRRLRRT